MDENLLLRVVMIEVGLLVGALIILFGNAGWLAFAAWRQRAPLAHAALVIRAALEGREPDRDNLAEVARLPTSAQVRVLVDLGASLDGAKKRRLATVADTLGLLDKAERWCSSRRWGTRLRGVRLFTLVGGGSAIVPRLFDDPHPEVRAQAAQWTGDHPSPSSVERLLTMLSDPEMRCRFTVEDSLMRVGRSAAEPLLLYLERGGRPEALEVAAGIADARFLPAALEYCRSPDARTRALAAALAGSIGGTKATEALADLLRDPDSEVRAAAAKGLGKLGHWPAAGALAECLRDSAWDVRLAAGLALRGLGAPGTLLLKRALADSDRFARDMAQQVLDLPDGRQPDGMRRRARSQAARKTVPA